MKRGGVIVALVAVLWWLFMGLPAGALRKHPAAVMVSGPSAEIFSLPGRERLIVYPTPQEGENYTFHLVRLTPQGEARLVGSYSIQLKGIRSRQYVVVNRLPELRYLVLPHHEGYLLVYEYLKSAPPEKKPPFHIYTPKETEVGLGSLLLRPDGSVESRGELVINRLLEPPKGHGRGGVWLAELSAGGDGRLVELYLLSKSDLFSNGTLYRFRLEAESLRVVEGPKEMGQVCSECLVQEAGGKLVIYQLDSPLIKYFSTSGSEAKYLVIDRLEPGPTKGRVELKWSVGLVRPPMPFGDGWLWEAPTPYEVWVRLGDSWYLSRSRPSDRPLIRTDREGRMLRLTRLPNSWRLQGSKVDDLALFRNVWGNQFALLDRRGRVRGFEIEQEGRLRPTSLPQWLVKRLNMLVYQPLDLEYAYLSQKENLFFGSKNSLQLIGGVGAVGLAARPDYYGPTTVRVVNYQGEPLYEVSFPEYEPPVDLSFLRPEEITGKRVEQFARQKAKLATPEGIYLLYQLKWADMSRIGADHVVPHDMKSAYRLALIRVTPQGKAELVGTINLAQAVERAGMELDPRWVSLQGDLLIALVPRGEPRVSLEVVPGRGEGGRVFLLFNYEASKVQIGASDQLGLVRREPDPPNRVLTSPNTFLCELELESAELGECYLLRDWREELAFDLESKMLLYPAQARQLVGLSLRAPVFFDGWGGYQGEIGTTIPLVGYQRELEIKAYSEIGFLGLIYSPGRVQFLDRFFRPSNLSHRLLCRWNEYGSIRSCVSLPSWVDKLLVDPAGSGTLWLQSFHSRHGRVVIMVDPAGGEGTTFYFDGERIQQEASVSPYLSFAIKTVSGPVRWRMLPNQVFRLNPRSTPDRSRLVDEGGAEFPPDHHDEEVAEANPTARSKG